MIVALFSVAAAMVAGGVWAVFTGWELIIIERGWTQVLAGTIVATGGVVLAGIATLANHLKRVETRLEEAARRAQTVPPPRVQEAGFSSRDIPAPPPRPELRPELRPALAETRPAETEPEPESESERERERERERELEIARERRRRLEYPQVPHSPEGGLSPVAAVALGAAAGAGTAAIAGALLGSRPQAEDRVEEQELERFEDLKADESAVPNGENVLISEEAVAERTVAEETVVEVEPGPEAEEGVEVEGVAVEGVEIAGARVEGSEGEEPGYAYYAGGSREGEFPGASASNRDALEHAPREETPDDIERPFAIFDEEEAAGREEEAATVHEPEEPLLGEEIAAGQSVEEPPYDTARERGIFGPSDADAEEEAEVAWGPAYAPPEPSPDIWPSPSGNEPESAEAGDLEAEPVDREAEPVPTAASPEAEAEPAAEVPEEAGEPVRSVIGTYESGGNTYTMYSDGSIDASTPAGDFHFASLDELKRFIAEGGEDVRG